MITNQPGLTYSRYPRPQDGIPPLRDQRPTEPGARTAPEKVSKKTRQTAWQVAQRKEIEDSMHDLVGRLNFKSNLYQDQVSFELDLDKKRPKILMKRESTVLNHYHTEDLIDLERSLHDMAGFQFSIEG